MARDKARAIRKRYHDEMRDLAQQLTASQSDRFPEEYRQREGAAIMRRINAAEATLMHDMMVWNHAQMIEAARLRNQDPMGSDAQETRRLREQMEITALAQQYPMKIQADNFLLPRARQALDAGDAARAQVYLAAAQRSGAYDGHIEAEINRLLDATVPARKQAIALAVEAADELELARRDVAQVRVLHKIGTPEEQVRASTTLKMADYKRQREAEVLKQESGIDLPPLTEG